MKLVPQAGLPLETIRVAGLKGKGGTTLLKNVAMLGTGIVDAFAVLKRQKPDVAFGVGGYAAGPMLLAIENYRTGLIWNLTSKNAELKTGLDRIFGVQTTNAAGPSQ